MVVVVGRVIYIYATLWCGMSWWVEYIYLRYSVVWLSLVGRVYIFTLLCGVVVVAGRVHIFTLLYDIIWGGG